MTRHLVRSVLAVGAAAVLAVGGAGSASAAGKGSIDACTDGTITSDQTQMSIVCSEGLGPQYRFEVQCSWYSAGKGGSFWHSSGWTDNGARATATCPGGSYVTGVGNTTYYS